MFTDCPSTLVIYGWPNSTAETYAGNAHFTFAQLLPDFTLPAELTTIEADAFSGISAIAVLIPRGVTSIEGNPFDGSSVRYIYGVSGSVAETFATTYGYTFVPVID